MNRIRALRKQHGLSQADVAKKLGVVQSTFSYWEQGKYDIDIASLKKLAEMFSCTTDYILGLTPVPCVNEHGVEVIPADPAAVAEEEAERARLRDENRENMRQVLNAMAQQKSPQSKAGGDKKIVMDALESLPPEGRKEAAEYIKYLLTKYGDQSK